MVASDALVYHKSMNASEMLNFFRMRISLSHWIESAYVVVSATLVFHRHADASEMVCSTSFGIYGGREYIVELIMGSRAGAVVMMLVANGLQSYRVADMKLLGGVPPSHLPRSEDSQGSLA